jgi:hypothetical protein
MPKEISTDPLMTPEETSAFLNDVATNTLAVWRCKGFGPPFVRVGRLIRYRKADVLAFLEARTVRP